jgi:hypothetical protein
MNLIVGTDAAGFTLIAERHHNILIQRMAGAIPALCQAYICIVKGKLLGSVQVVKGISHEIRAGMLGSGNYIHCNYLFLYLLW